MRIVGLGLFAWVLFLVFFHVSIRFFTSPGLRAQASAFALLAYRIFQAVQRAVVDSVMRAAYSMAPRVGPNLKP